MLQTQPAIPVPGVYNTEQHTIPLGLIESEDAAAAAGAMDICRFTELLAHDMLMRQRIT